MMSHTRHTRELKHPITPSDWRRIRANLFPAAISAVEPWQAFPWHSNSRGSFDTHQPHSSQALAIDVFGTLQSAQSRNTILNTLAEQLGLPDSQDWQVSLEWLDPDNLLAEPRRSQIDAVARSAENLIFFECKFTEQSAGACTQPNLRRGVRQCNSNYELQTNPINSKTARFALPAKGIRYWEHIPEIFTFGADQDHTPCPFAGSWYQWMRNLVQCNAVSRHYNLRPAFVVVYADGLFAVAKEIRSPAWQRFLSTLRPRHLPLATLSYQELVALAKQNSAPQEMATWQALEEWVNRKIKSVVGSTPV